MKKTISIILTAFIVTAMLTGCSFGDISSIPTPTTAPSEIDTPTEAPTEQASVTPAEKNEVEPVEIKIGGLKGPTSMGLVKLMESAELAEAANNYVFSISGSADEVTPKLIKGDLDMAAVPANLASVLYNNTNGEVQILAVNTLGVIYIVEKGNEIQSFEDLKGKTIYATAKGSTPEYALRYLLSENGIDPDNDVTLEWKSQPTEVVALFSELENGVAMLPQPYVTVAQNQIDNLRIAIDLTKQWDILDNGSDLITGVLVVRREFAEKYPEQIAVFLDEYKQSTDFVNNNIPEAAKLVEKYGIVNAVIAEKAIPYCNIFFMEGAKMKSSMQGYLEVLFEQNPKAIGGKLPENDFYYER
ncbi:MAG: ABC transporter substrate-binding protein [Clostridiaceae bacterium]|nr:ABC transporter substrate-binding protein [Clostridiaceae bacterium]